MPPKPLSNEELKLVAQALGVTRLGSTTEELVDAIRRHVRRHVRRRAKDARPRPPWPIRLLRSW